MKLSANKLTKGQTVIIDGNSIKIHTIEETFAILKGRGANGRKSTTDYGRIIINGEYRLTKRTKVSVVEK